VFSSLASRPRLVCSLKFSALAQPRSRQNTGQSRRRGGDRSDGSSNSNNGLNVENGNWKVVNALDYSCYPLLFEIDKQLQLLSVQLREAEFTNSLQLRLLYRMMKFLIASKSRAKPSSDVPFGVWLLMFFWPLAVQLSYYLYKKHRDNIMLAFMDYL